jgi:hypothetical protein
MNFYSHFNLLNYIITNYESITYDLILNKPVLESEEFICSDDYLMWHILNVGTNMNTIKITAGTIPLFKILQKPKKYYFNIFINNNTDFLELAFNDIFFEKIKICVMISGFMRNYNLTLSVFKNFFKNYHVDYYVHTYDIIGMGNYESEFYTPDKFNIDDLQKIIPIKNFKIKNYSECKLIDENIVFNKLYYQTLNVYNCYELVNENYFFYIRMRPDLSFENLDTLLNEHFDSIIDNKIIVHGKIPKITETNDEYKISNDIPFDGFAIGNIKTIDIYCKFHLHIDKYLLTNIHNNKEIHENDINPEKMLYYYLVKKGINVIPDKICQINRTNISGAINKNALLRGRR